jgi:hypothetical protein
MIKTYIAVGVALVCALLCVAIGAYYLLHAARTPAQSPVFHWRDLLRTPPLGRVSRIQLIMEGVLILSLGGGVLCLFAWRALRDM